MNAIIEESKKNNLSVKKLWLDALPEKIYINDLLKKYSCNIRVKNILAGIRPAVLAMILYAGLQIGKIAITNSVEILIFVVVLAMMRIWKKSPIFYLFVASVLGIVLKF